VNGQIVTEDKLVMFLNKKVLSRGLRKSRLQAVSYDCYGGGSAADVEICFS